MMRGCQPTRTPVPSCPLEAFTQRVRRGRCLGVALMTLAGCLVGLTCASAAFADSPWWHVTSGSRPTYLPTGLARNEVQSLKVAGSSGTYFLEEPVRIGRGEVEEGVTFVRVPFNASAAEVEAALVVLYGIGDVAVTEAPVGSREFAIDFKNGRGDREVQLAASGEAEPTVTEVTRGRADGEIYVTAENLGDANVSGETSPVRLTDILPPGLKAVGIAGTKPQEAGDFQERAPISCELASLTCTLTESLAPYDSIELRIAVVVEGASSGASNEAFVSGGGAQPASARRHPITVTNAPTPFGVEEYEMALEEEGGAPTTQAGAHPFQFTTTITVNQNRDVKPLEGLKSEPEVTPAALAKDLNFRLPPGLIGNPTPFPQCTYAQFFTVINSGNENECPSDTAVGVAVATVHEPATVGTATIVEPVFSLEPRNGEPARFGFYVTLANSPVFIDTAVRTGGDYGVTASANNITETGGFLSSEVTFWGVPGDPRHDKQRGWGCLYEARGMGTHSPCNALEAQSPPPFLSLPTSCAVSLETSVEGDSWLEPRSPESFLRFPGEFVPAQTLDGCNRLQFRPEIKIATDRQQASTPTGLTTDVHVPQEANKAATGLASANVRDVTLTFPQGVTVNPAAADGLLACAEGQVGLESGKGAQEELLFTPTLPEGFCPDASKVGTVKIKTPLLPPGQSLEGGLYLATPAPNGEGGTNPFSSLLAMYIVAKDPVSGVLVKLAGKSSLNPTTGQISATFENTPDLTFEDAEVHLFGGERAPLATPSHCGTYTTEATFTPWSGTTPIKSSSSFQVTAGPNGSSCPPAALPFAPALAAGTSSISAGSFSPLTTTIGREDGNQDIETVKLRMPPGLEGSLAGVALCGEAQADAGACGPESQIGEVTASVGLGADPFTVTGGKVYLTGPYAGAPFGLSIVTPAKAGPFDLGKVIVRAKIEIDPLTEQITVTTDTSGPYAIPHILDGIPLEIKHVNVAINRPGFTLNPTNCNTLAFTGTITSDEAASAPVSSTFQATNCATLKFAPDFKVSTSGHTSKENGASLSVKLLYPKARLGTYANVAKVKVDLPKQLPSRLTTLQKACLAAVFEKNPAACPPASIVGHATVVTPLLPVPLVGPAYFVSHGNEKFPSLTIILQGYGVTAELIGSTLIKNGITSTTYRSTPDVPFNSFELTLPQGKYSALGANGNLCTSKLAMPTAFVAQNGVEIHTSTKISVTGCTKPLTLKQKRARALTACHKKHNHATRTTCERDAKRRYKQPTAGKR
jgi:hypothetical protein